METLFLVLMTLLLVVGGICVLLNGEGSRDKFFGTFFLVLGIMFVMMWGVYIGEGNFAKDNGINKLKVNEIYEVVSSKKVDKGVAVFLLERDGSLKAYLLDRKPPKVFKKTDNKDNPYQSYP